MSFFDKIHNSIIKPIKEWPIYKTL